MPTSLPECAYQFPDANTLIQLDDEGVVGIGADLQPQTILAAYRQGIFQWFNPNEPIVWWSPNPRCVIYPNHYHMSKSLIRQCHKNQYTLTVNTAFAQVITACSQPRRQSTDSWIGISIINAYTQLFKANHAYSIEVWDSTGNLVGGLYGVMLAGAWFGESMFSTHRDVSKMAFSLLMQIAAHYHIPWIDCQLVNPHLLSLGAVAVDRQYFLQQLLPCALKQPAVAWDDFNGKVLAVADLVQYATATHHP